MKTYQLEALYKKRPRNYHIRKLMEKRSSPVPQQAAQPIPYDKTLIEEPLIQLAGAKYEKLLTYCAAAFALEIQKGGFNNFSIRTHEIKGILADIQFALTCHSRDLSYAITDHSVDIDLYFLGKVRSQRHVDVSHIFKIPNGVNSNSAKDPDFIATLLIDHYRKIIRTHRVDPEAMVAAGLLNIINDFDRQYRSSSQAVSSGSASFGGNVASEKIENHFEQLDRNAKDSLLAAYAMCANILGVNLMAGAGRRMAEFSALELNCAAVVKAHMIMVEKRDATLSFIAGGKLVHIPYGSFGRPTPEGIAYTLTEAYVAAYAQEFKRQNEKPDRHVPMPAFPIRLYGAFKLIRTARP